MDHFNGAAILYVKLPVTMNVCFPPWVQEECDIERRWTLNLTIDDDVSVVMQLDSMKSTLKNRYYDYLRLDIVHAILISCFVLLFLSVSASNKLFANHR